MAGIPEGNAIQLFCVLFYTSKSQKKSLGTTASDYKCSFTTSENSLAGV